MRWPWKKKPRIVSTRKITPAWSCPLGCGDGIENIFTLGDVLERIATYESTHLAEHCTAMEMTAARELKRDPDHFVEQARAHVDGLVRYACALAHICWTEYGDGRPHDLVPMFTGKDPPALRVTLRRFSVPFHYDARLSATMYVVRAAAATRLMDHKISAIERVVRVSHDLAKTLGVTQDRLDELAVEAFSIDWLPYGMKLTADKRDAAIAAWRAGEYEFARRLIAELL